jgi:hypothetical protein
MMIRRAPQFLVVITDEMVLKDQTPAEHRRDSSRDAANISLFNTHAHVRKEGRRQSQSLKAGTRLV